jgi:hypothetical protein
MPTVIPAPVRPWLWAALVLLGSCTFNMLGGGAVAALPLPSAGGGLATGGVVGTGVAGEFGLLLPPPPPPQPEIIANTATEIIDKDLRQDGVFPITPPPYVH